MERFSPIIGNPVADSAALLRRLAFFLLFLLLPVAAVIGRRAVVLIVPIAIALLVIAAALDGENRPLLRSLKRLFRSYTALAALLFLGWCALSLLWSPFPAQGWERLSGLITGIAMIFIGYLALPERMRSSNLYLLPIGIAAAAVLALAVEFTLLTGGSFINLEDVFQRGMLVEVLLFWPAFAWLSSRHRDTYAVILAVALVGALYCAPDRAALAAFLVGAFGYVAVKIAGDKGTRLAAGVAAGLLALGPLLPFVLRPVAKLLHQPALAASLKVAGDLILSDPMQVVTGQGFEAAARARVAGALDFRAPLSAMFQIWYELGIVGAWSLAIVIYSVIGKAGRKHPPLAPGMTAGFLSAYLFALMGSGSVQSWWTTALASTVLVFIAMTRGQFRTARPQIFFVRS